MRLMMIKNYNIKKSIESFKKFWKFRVEEQPGKIDPVIRKLCEKNSRNFWHFHDKNKNPCCVAKLKYLKHEHTGIDNMAKYFLWCCEQGRQLSRHLGTGKLVILYDRKDHFKNKFSPKAMNSAIKLLGELSDYYPYQCESFYIIHTNFFFRFIYGMVKPFLPKYLKKIVKTVKKYVYLQEFFGKDCLLKEHGGFSDFNYDTPNPGHRMYFYRKDGSRFLLKDDDIFNKELI